MTLYENEFLNNFSGPQKIARFSSTSVIDNQIFWQFMFLLDLFFLAPLLEVDPLLFSWPPVWPRLTFGTSRARTTGDMGGADGKTSVWQWFLTTLWWSTREVRSSTSRLSLLKTAGGTTIEMWQPIYEETGRRCCSNWLFIFDLSILIFMLHFWVIFYDCRYKLHINVV